MKPEVLIYTTSWCPFCRRAKALLKEKGVAFTELDIEADPAHRKAMIETSGRSTVSYSPILGQISFGFKLLSVPADRFW